VLLAAAILMLAAAWLPAQKDRGKRDKGKDKPPDPAMKLIVSAVAFSAATTKSSPWMGALEMFRQSP
jgi:hypothetical protein